MLFLHRSAMPALCLSLLFTSVLPVQAEDAASPAVEKPAERQALPERSQQEASALERQVPQQEQQQLQAGSDSFLALWKPANSAEAVGVVILIPGAGENADWPQAIAPLRRKLPDAAWGTLSLSLPDVSVDTLPPRLIEPPKAAVDTSSKEGSTAAKPVEQAASAEAEGTDPAVVPGRMNRTRPTPSASSTVSTPPSPSPRPKAPAAWCCSAMAPGPGGRHATSARNNPPRCRGW